MSSDEKPESRRLKKDKNDGSITEDFLIDFFKNYNIEYTTNIEELAINLALRGQEALKQDEISIAEDICNLLTELSIQWKDGFIKMKAHLLNAELAGYKNEDKIPHLKKALLHAKKNNIQDVEVGVRIQLAFEEFRVRNYKSVLKDLKSIEKHSDLFEDNKRVVYELKARVYWEKDDFSKGFQATYDWYKILKVSLSDIHSLFMTIVYLLTVMSSTSLPNSEDELKEIQNDITSLLTNLATSIHLFPQILPFIDVLFAKSLKLVQPDILHDFTDLILQTSRWNDEEKYLYLCHKIAEAYYNLDDTEKSVEVIDKAISYTKDKKYDKVEKIIRYTKAEHSSLIFYFMNFDNLFDPWMIENVKIRIGDKEENVFLNPLSSGVNTFPATSYSHLLRIIEKASDRHILENSLELEGLNPDEERGFFVLDIEIADDRIRLLMREDFNIDNKDFKTLHSTLTPYYTVIGLVSKEKTHDILEIEGIENILLRIQRAINCPASKATIYLSKEKPHLNLFRFYLQQGGFRDLRIKLIDTAQSLGREYDFARNEDFLQIFQADPITIFDLTLRNSQQLDPLTYLINQAYGLRISNVKLHQFLNDLIDNFLKRSDSRFWKDFYYEYAWLQTQGVFLSLPKDQILEKKKTVEKTISFAYFLDSSSKILEGLYFRTYVSLILNEQSLNENIAQLRKKSEEYKNEKYLLISQILEQLSETTEYSEVETVSSILNNFCELCEFRDWQLSLELFIYLLDKLPQLTTLFEICKKKDIKDAGTYLYLHISRYMIDVGRFNEALQLIQFVQEVLKKRKKNFFFSEHTWNYLDFLANQYKYEIFRELSQKEIKKYNLNKEEILSDILKNDEWISDPIYLVSLLIEYSDILLSKSDFSMGNKYYHWIEQMMFYFWDQFTSESNSTLLKEIHELKKRIESQHFI